VDMPDWIRALAASQPFGAGDRRGTANLIDAAARARAAACIRTGNSVSLARPLLGGDHNTTEERPGFRHETWYRPAPDGTGWGQDHLVLNPLRLRRAPPHPRWPGNRGSGRPRRVPARGRGGERGEPQPPRAELTSNESRISPYRIYRPARARARARAGARAGAGAEDVDGHVIRARVMVRADPGCDRVLVAVRDQRVHQPVARLAGQVVLGEAEAAQVAHVVGQGQVALVYWTAVRHAEDALHQGSVAVPEPEQEPRAEPRQQARAARPRQPASAS
jgi:hypothetical protein